MVGVSKAVEDLTAKMLRMHEGVREHPYTDTVGKLTIGVGFNLDDDGLDQTEIDFILRHRIDLRDSELRRYSTYVELDTIRKAVLVDMAFNLGLTRLRRFQKMWEALERKDFETAAAEMLDSKWARQVGRRASRLAKMMRTGLVPDEVYDG